MIVPTVPGGSTSVWAQYTLRVKEGQDRDAIMAKLKDAGVPSVVYYPRPLHEQTAYKDVACDPEGLANSSMASASVFSLPMHPFLTEESQDQIVTAVQQVLTPAGV